MKYKVRMTEEAGSVIRALPPGLKSKIREAIDRIIESPYSAKPLKHEFEGYWSYRVIRYRIVYEVVRSKIEILLVMIGHRKEIYNWLSLWIQQNEKT